MSATPSSESSPEQVVEIAANLDDVTPEVIGQAVGALLAEGALDVWTTAIAMKKQRPGVCLSLLCHPADCECLARRVIDLTGSFGVRYRTWDRLVLDRRIETVDTPFGPMPIKLGLMDGRVVTAKPEFDVAAALAAQHNQPVRVVLAAGQAAAESLRDREGDA